MLTEIETANFEVSLIKLDAKRTHRQTAETRKCAAPNVPATAKIRLLILLQKLQTLHVDYALLSQYFTDCMKGMDQNSSDVAVISSALIYEKPDW